MGKLKLKPSVANSDNTNTLETLSLSLGNTGEDDIRACASSDEQLRHVMFGDPLMHVMALYKRRIEVLALKAVTGRGSVYLN
jgi:hypothetical protein